MELNRSEESEFLNWSSDSEENGEIGKSKMDWVIDKGLSVGKKLVVAGFVISSAPLVLPPLLVISALGFAVSVPFGFVYASYACTEKLMSKLLPSQVIIPPHLLLGYATLKPQDENEEEIVSVVEEGLKPSLEMVEGESEVGSDGVKLVDSDKIGGEMRDEEQINLPVVEKLKEDVNGSEKDVKNGNIVETESSNVERISGMKKSSSSKETERKGKTKGFAKLKFSSKKKGSGGDRVVENFSVEERKLVKECGQTGEELSSEVVADEREELNSEVVADEREELSSEVVADEMAAPEKMGSSREKEEAVARECVLNGVGNVDDSQDILSSMNLENIENVSQGKDARPVDAEEEAKETNYVASEANLEQQGVKDDVISNVQGGLVEENQKIPESYKQSRSLTNDSKSSLEVETLTDMPEIKHDETSDLKGNESVREADAAEGQFEDEKIWGQIDAIRVIIGFNAPRLPSYVEELKALYSFTGIELPSSFMDPWNISEFHDKLGFLMSVIGVK